MTALQLCAHNVFYEGAVTNDFDDVHLQLIIEILTGVQLFRRLKCRRSKLKYVTKIFNKARLQYSLSRFFATSARSIGGNSWNVLGTPSELFVTTLSLSNCCTIL
eukprot:sb/3477913/